jgi:hypothetical protein
MKPLLRVYMAVVASGSPEALTSCRAELASCFVAVMQSHRCYRIQHSCELTIFDAVLDVQVRSFDELLQWCIIG